MKLIKRNHYKGYNAWYFYPILIIHNVCIKGLWYNKHKKCVIYENMGYILLKHLKEDHEIIPNITNL